MRKTYSCLVTFLACAIVLSAQANLGFLNHGKPVLDAHNCYPYEGQWADRIDRALSAGFPVSIEQDLAWFAKPGSPGRAVIVHDPKTMTGEEPDLRVHFFERVRPIVEKALREGNRDQWPLIILHLDFKINEAPLLEATWDLLGEYESWLTTAVKSSDDHELLPLDRKPILALTEDSDAQEIVFFRNVPLGGKLRLFGSAHNAKIPGESDRERARFAANLAPDKLLTESPTNYRRWWNNSWAVVEEGGQRNAGDWNATDVARLRSLVRHAHRQGFWIRFYTLDVFSPAEDKGWDRNYNFGSRAAALPRWRAATEAGVDFISTDQYEDLAKILGR